MAVTLDDLKKIQAKSIRKAPTTTALNEKDIRVVRKLTQQEAEEQDRKYEAREREQAVLHKARAFKALEAMVGERYSRERASLAAFACQHKGQRQTVSKVLQLAEQAEALSKEGRGITWYGPTGTGKDHLAIAWMYLALEALDVTALWVHCESLFEQFRGVIKKESATAEAELVAKYAAPDILCLSDPLPFAGELTDWQVRALGRIGTARSHSMKMTLCTVNCANLEEAEKRLTPPVFRRLMNDAELIPCFWPCHRR